jgi:pimeloyl-ACP methyl ester carboxylesterase
MNHEEGLAQSKSERYVRPVNELWEMWKPRVKMRIYPFTYALYDDMERVMTSLTSYDRDTWAAAFSAVAKPYEEKAAQAEKTGDAQSAKENYLRAYQYYRLARFPTINSEGKKQAYRKSQEMLLKAARYFDVPIERVEIPFKPQGNEGNQIIAYLRVPKTGSGPFPLLFSWGGIDGFKEEQLNDEVLEHGLATLAIDGPGVGDSPLKGSENAERLFEAVLNWINTRIELDAKKVAIWGYSTGGYWAVKVAHVYKDRITCAVSQGGPVHYAFEPEWINQQERGEYVFEVYDTLAFAFGKSGYEEWIEYAPKLSLLKQGILDKPCAPLLLINGVHDSLFPIKDYYLLFEQGSPKCARFFESGHMGFTRDTNKINTDWIYGKLI